jgi:hypothetical protein
MAANALPASTVLLVNTAPPAGSSWASGRNRRSVHRDPFLYALRNRLSLRERLLDSSSLIAGGLAPQ